MMQRPIAIPCTACSRCAALKSPRRAAAREPKPSWPIFAPTFSSWTGGSTSTATGSHGSSGCVKAAPTFRSSSPAAIRAAGGKRVWRPCRKSSAWQSPTPSDALLATIEAATGCPLPEPANAVRRKKKGESGSRKKAAPPRRQDASAGLTSANSRQQATAAKRWPRSTGLLT